MVGTGPELLLVDLWVSLSRHVELDADPDDLLAGLGEESALLALKVVACWAGHDTDRRGWREECHEFVAGWRSRPFSRGCVEIAGEIELCDWR